MANGDFIWADLSTFDLAGAQSFYRGLFGWSYQSDSTGYHLCYAKLSEAAGLYEMPAKFQAFNLPSFWMSYIEVADLDAVVAQAKQLGGKIEVRPESFDANSRVALIRDPAGAGFTI